MKDKTTKVEVIDNPTAENLKFFADVEAAEKSAREKIEKDGVNPVFLTKRWREKTGFPIGIILDHELAAAEFWRRTRARWHW